MDVGDWRGPLYQHGVQTVLIAPDVALASVLRSDPNWVQAFETDKSVIHAEQER